jgi:hypothetical protein
MVLLVKNINDKLSDSGPEKVKNQEEFAKEIEFYKENLNQ